MAGVLSSGAGMAQTAPTWTDIGALFAEQCTICNSGPDAPLGLHLDTLQGALDGGVNGPSSGPAPPTAASWCAPSVVRARRACRSPARRSSVLPSSRPWSVGSQTGSRPVRLPVPRRLGSSSRGLAQATPSPLPMSRRFSSSVAPSATSTTARWALRPKGFASTATPTSCAAGSSSQCCRAMPASASSFAGSRARRGRARRSTDRPWLNAEDIELLRRWVVQSAANVAGERAPIPAGRPVRLRGILTGHWALDGAPFIVDGGTRLRKPPAAGEAAELRGVVTPDGSVRATRLRRR